MHDPARQRRAGHGSVPRRRPPPPRQPGPGRRAGRQGHARRTRHHRPAHQSRPALRPRGAAAEAIDQLISRNARVSQDQSEYQRRFDKLTSEHAALLDEYHQLLAQISDLENRQAAYCYYKEQLAILDPASIEFTPYLWHTLVDHAEVGTDDTITFTFRDGAKQTQHIGK